MKEKGKPAAVRPFPPGAGQARRSSDALKHKSYEKAKAALESGTELLSKRVKAIKLVD